VLVYTAGAITYYQKINQLQDAILWRIKTKDTFKNTGIDIFDPTVNYENNLTYDSKGVPYQNLHFLQNADIILVNLEHIAHSPGTLWEIFIGWYLHKPIVGFGDSRLLEQPHIKEAVTIHFDNLEDSIEYIKSMYLQ
jgi:nucleoside 2-deoxyribosyltransferase